ncbi:ATP-binding protein [Rhodovulum sp. DZ06]|uniref:ATP-binding protein n=1 Tax=Rhodovulum sp. DZ06 TaxID=3425126 RepID=UPI003D33BCF2
MIPATLAALLPALGASAGGLAAAASGASFGASAAAILAGLGGGALVAWLDRPSAAARQRAADAEAAAHDAELRAARARADAAERAIGLGRRALARLPRPLLLVDQDGRVIFANPAAHTLFERLRVGEHYSMTFRNPDFLEALSAALNGGEVHSFDFTLHGDRGLVIRAHLDGEVDLGGDPGARHVLCLFEDRTQEMQSIRMRTDFIANASHELRTPLASIRGFLETLQGPAKDDPEAQERFMGIMQAQAERMQRLVDDLLSLNRIELNQHIRPSDEEAFGAVVRDVLDAMEPMARERGVEVIAGAFDEGPVVRCDRHQLSQALSNLVENALKYGGGKPVRVFPEPPSPTHPGLVGVTVADSGEGIAREHLPRLTERFYRVSIKRSRDQGGTGLGLAIVKHILARHRGELTVRSAQGAGAAFTIWLPALGGAAWATPGDPTPVPGAAPDAGAAVEFSGPGAERRPAEGPATPAPFQL